MTDREMAVQRIVLLSILLMLLNGCLRLEDTTTFDLTSPSMTNNNPAVGKRVRQVAAEFEGTDVHHSLYLPTDWEQGKRYPVIVEYTGNKWNACRSTGKVEDANLGFGMSGGKGFIWIVLPCVSSNGQENSVMWWGDKDATIEYCKSNLPRICDQYGGDLNNVFLCGFSRGAIGASYIGLADDEIASFWKAIFTHDHFDGQKTWGYPDSDRDSALKRLSRIKGRPVLVCGTNATEIKSKFLEEHLDLAQFTFLNVPTDQIFSIPEGDVVHTHTDLWMHKPSEYREQVRTWMSKQITFEDGRTGR